jgi:hypothetical protein
LLGAVGVGLMAATYLGLWAWAELRPLRGGGWVDPDWLFLWVTVAYWLAAWMIAAVGTPPPDQPPWRQARFWVHVFAWGAPTSALLLLWSQYVPIWQYENFASAARLPAFLVIGSTLAVFRYLAYVASGSRVPVLGDTFRLAGGAATVGAIIFCVGWSPGRQSLPPPHENILFPPLLFFVFALFLYPLVMLMCFVPVLIGAARAKQS